jgi:hypothetical protein
VRRLREPARRFRSSSPTRLSSPPPLLLGPPPRRRSARAHPARRHGRPPGLSRAGGQCGRRLGNGGRRCHHRRRRPARRGAWVLLLTRVRARCLQCAYAHACPHPPSSLQVAADSGSVSAWSVRGHDLLREPILPLFYRAPTDNDRGGSGGNSHANRCGRRRVEIMGSRGVRPPPTRPHPTPRHSWKEAGLDRMAVQPDTVKLATTPGEGGSVKARKREGGWEEREERSAARLSPHLCTRRSPPPSPCAPPAPRSRRRASPSSA